MFKLQLWKYINYNLEEKANKSQYKHNKLSTIATSEMWCNSGAKLDIVGTTIMQKDLFKRFLKGSRCKK